MLYHRLKHLGLNYLPGEDVSTLISRIELYYKLLPGKRKEIESELDFLRHRVNTDIKFSVIFPYDFSLEYDHMKVRAFKDEDNGLYYVKHKGKRLYYSREFNNEAIVRYMYTSICIEQDPRSPHCYLTKNFDVMEGDIVLDIGAAEGNFSLDVVERAGKIYLFETDERWIEALNLTFAPWKDKVEIINKYVSDSDNGRSVKLSTLFAGKKIDFIKMDVEGAEVKILRSSRDIIDRQKNIRLAVCTYHTNEDATLIEEIMKIYRIDYEFSEGYMLFIYSHLTPPYFRKVLLRASRKN